MPFNFVNKFSLVLTFAVLSLFSLAQNFTEIPTTPNIIIICVDDLGYGDLGVYGSRKNSTPNIDKLAVEGVMFTDFYAAASVSTPSRAALLTGCYPQRIDMHMDTNRHCVLLPIAYKGLNPEEMTIAAMLKSKHYKTACIGKWHLGDQKEFMPLHHGFDYYFGIPYSNSMVFMKSRPYQPPLPLLENDFIVEAPLRQENITKRLTARAIDFIKLNRREPFFLYFAHPMLHAPLQASKEFQGVSKNLIYGDALMEVDWSVGEIMKILTHYDLSNDTLVILTSDNGASLKAKINGNILSSNRPLSGWKGETYEGGMRVPAIMRWPKIIPAGLKADGLASQLDILPTIASITGADLPPVKIDGKNILKLMTKEGAESPNDVFFYYQRDQLQAVRSGLWKLHLSLRKRIGTWGNKHEKDTPLKLFYLKNDIAEKRNIADDHPQIVAKLLRYAEAARDDLGDFYCPGKNMRPAGKVKYPIPIVTY